MVRRKKRYVVVKAEPEFEAERVAKAVEEAYLKLFGEYGLAEAGLKVTRKIRGRAILECALESLPRLTLSIASVTKIEGVPAALRILRVSGTVRGAREAVARRP